MKLQLVLGLVLLAGACAPTTGGAGSPNTSKGADLHDRGSAVASISGTTVDAKSGEPLANVEIKGPGGAHARSDAKGRFLLSNLAVGASGNVEAKAGDGRHGSVPLRPLAEGRLEIVLHLR